MKKFWEKKRIYYENEMKLNWKERKRVRKAWEKKGKKIQFLKQGLIRLSWDKMLETWILEKMFEVLNAKVSNR